MEIVIEKKVKLFAENYWSSLFASACDTNIKNNDKIYLCGLEFHGKFKKEKITKFSFNILTENVKTDFMEYTTKNLKYKIVDNNNPLLVFKSAPKFVSLSISFDNMYKGFIILVFKIVR